MKTKSTRFNFVSETGDGLGFAARLVAEGEDVRMWIRSAEGKSIGDNIVTKVGDLEDLYHDADPASDVFIFDVSGNGLTSDFFASQGFAVFGGSILADRLERDRDYGAQVMQSCDIDVPETLTFNNFEKAIQHVEENPETRWVYKPSKQLGDLSPSHVSYDAEDLIEMLRNIASEVEIADPQFELQAFEKGIALSTELWFNHGQYVETLTNHTLERKELMNDDLGPSGGCLGNIVWACGYCPICEVATQLVPWARREQYHGMLDLNVIVAEADSNVYGLEFTPRFGYDASPTLFWELVDHPLAKFFADTARGQLNGVQLRDGFGSALRVTIPPWPSEKFTAEENVPIRGLDDEKLRNTYLYNVKRDDNDNLCSAGAWGILTLFTAHSMDVQRAFNKPMERAKELRVKNKQYRTDLGRQFKNDLTKLEELTNVRTTA